MRNVNKVLLRRLAIIGLGASLALGSVGIASASHDHYLSNPGTTVIDIARGNTDSGAGEPAYHKFHDNVHTGTPGTMMNANPENPVTIYK